MRYFSALLIFLSGFSFAHDKLAAPEYYEAKGVCPFECCRYREWRVDARTEVYEQAHIDSPIIATLHENEMATAATGFIKITQPGLVRVVRSEDIPNNIRQYQNGQLLSVYSYLGEGYFQVWHNGEMVEEDLFFLTHGYGGWALCVEENNCWGEAVRYPVSEWWVQVKNNEGVSGWTNKAENFSNKDACG